MSKETKSEARTGLDIEWKRLSPLVPQIISDPIIVEDIEKDIFSLIDGKSTCEEIVKVQNSFSRDGAVLILLKLERDGIISCIEPFERLRDVKFERCESEKELEFTRMERRRLQDRISKEKDEISGTRLQSRRLKDEISSINKKIEGINKNIKKLSDNYREATRSVDRLVSKKMDILKKKKAMDESVSVIREETMFLKDEKCSAMRSIRELETKIDEVLEQRESVIPKITVYRSVMREAYKTLRDAQLRADHALKGVE